MKALARWLGVGLSLVILNSPLQAQEKVLSARTTQGFDATLEQVQDVLKSTVLVSPIFKNAMAVCMIWATKQTIIKLCFLGGWKKFVR